MHRAILRLLASAAVALSLAACSAGPQVRQAPDGSHLAAPDSVGADSDKVADYRIGPQDVLEVAVFGVTDLSRTVRVGGDGGISLPLIGRVQAGGRTTQELQDEIAGDLSKNYLQNPQVSVFVKDFASQQVTIEGSVGKPGIYPVMGDTTLMQAIAQAGGLTRLAQDNGVVVFRTIQGKRMAAVFNYGKISQGKGSDPRIYAGDIVMVQQSGSKNALENFIRAAPAIGLFLLY